MPLALRDRQAVEMWAKATLKKRCAVNEKMVRRYRSGHTRGMRPNEVGSLRGCYVLYDDLQSGVPLEKRKQALLHEDGFPVKDIDGGVGRLSVDQERHADFLHAFQHARKSANVRDAIVSIGGGARGI